MNEAKFAKASRKHTILIVLGITVLMLLMLVSITGAAVHPGYWGMKGDSIRNLGKYNEAIKAYDKALEIDPRYYAAWRGKGKALYSLGKFDEAIKAYDKAIETNPQQYSNDWYYKGLALDKLGKSDEAKKAYQKASEIKSRKHFRH